MPCFFVSMMPICLELRLRGHNMDTVVEGGDESRCLDAMIPSCPLRTILICLESISILLSSPTVLGEKHDMLMVVKK